MKAVVVANWKMNPATFKEAKLLFEATKKAAERSRSVSFIVAPPVLYVRDLVRLYRGRRITFALQHASVEKSGAFTGEISQLQAKDSKANAVIIGHAERRAMGESNDDVRRKVAAALGNKLTPILCIGERSRDSSGEYYTFVKEQLAIALADVPPQKVASILIAYEPVWAIGATKPMDAREMHEMTIFIRKTIVETHGKDGMNARVLYGGAVDETNARRMMEDGAVHGFLVGRASLDAARLSALIQSLE